MTHEEALKRLEDILNHHGVRKHLNINNFGHSQIEREIVSLFISVEDVTVNSTVFIPKGNAGKECYGTIDSILYSFPPLYFCKEFNEALFREEFTVVETK